MPTISGQASANSQPGIPLSTFGDSMWRPEANGIGFTWEGRDEAYAERMWASIGDDTLVMQGELFGGKEGSGPNALRLLEGYAAEGDAYLSRIEGRFAAAFWSESRRELTLLTDKFGSVPLYYSANSDSLSFSTSVRRASQIAGASPAWDTEGLIQFFTFGHLWNSTTLLKSVRCLGPATRCTFSIDTGRVEQHTYWQIRPSQRPITLGASLDRIDETLCRAVDEQSRDTPGLGVALSGGLDARAILGLISDELPRPTCLSLGMEGSLDQVSARKLAKLSGCPFHRFVLGEGFLECFEGWLDRMVELTDGHYLSQCIVMPTLPLYPELGVRVLLRGHVGELLHMHKAYNFSVDDEFRRLEGDDSLESWLWSHLQSHLTDCVDLPLLAAVSSSDFKEVGRQTLRAAMKATDRFERPLDRLSQMFLDQRLRRETAMSLVKFNSVVDVRVPYLDSRFVQAVFDAPPEARIGERAHTEVLRRHRPSFLLPANSNTGARVGAGPAWRTICYLRMRVLAKLGVRGYQPYERLGLWLRRELREVVERTLLDAKCLDRGLLNPDCVRGVVAAHNAGAKNHTFLIMAMMIVERGSNLFDSPAISEAGRCHNSPAGLA